jgi:hypothetical protein
MYEMEGALLGRVAPGQPVALPSLCRTRRPVARPPGTEPSRSVARPPRPYGPPAGAVHPREVPVSRFLSRPGVPSEWCPFPTVKYFYCLGGVPRKGLAQSHCEFLSCPHAVHRTQAVNRN